MARKQSSKTADLPERSDELSRGKGNDKTRSNSDGRNSKPNDRSGKTRSRRSQKSNRNSGGRRSTAGPKGGSSFYEKYPELISAVARIPFPYKPGDSINLQAYTATKRIYDADNQQTLSLPNFSSRQVQKMTVPGVLAMAWGPSVGRSTSTADPASQAAFSMWSLIRSAFSGSLEADGNDIEMYLLCLDSLFSYIAALKRIYRALDSVTPYSYNYPYTIMQALGFNKTATQQLRNEKPSLLAYINSLIDRSQVLVMPYQMSLFDRHYILNDNVFLDAPSPIAQVIVPRQDSFYCFTSTGPAEILRTLNGGNTALTFINTDSTVKATAAVQVCAPWASNGIIGTGEKGGLYQWTTLNTLQHYGDALLEALVNNEDAHIINGYLMRVFGAVQHFSVGLLMPEEKLEPVYSPEMLTQFQNARAIPITDDFTKQLEYNSGPVANSEVWNLQPNQKPAQYQAFKDLPDVMTIFGIPRIDSSVYQNPSSNAILSTPLYWQFGHSTNDNIFAVNDGCAPYLNLDSDTPTSSEIIEAMRLHAVISGGRFSTHNRLTFNNISGGTEIVHGWQLFTDPAGTKLESHGLTTPNMVMQQLAFDSVALTEILGATPTNQAQVVINELRKMLVVSNFNSFPLIRLISSDPEEMEFSLLGDVKNFTTFELTTFDLINKYALMSLLSVFSI